MSTLIALVLGFATVPAETIDRIRLDRIDVAVETAIKADKCPGAVVVVIHDDVVVFRKAYGHRATTSEKVAMTADTVFDMASLTKPVATATSIHILIEKGKLKLSDKVATHWPAFAANGKEAITVEQCLLHVTGLTADNAIADYKGTRAEMLANVANLKLEVPVGTRFRYSDVGFIVLGELVERVGGVSLDEFAAKNVFTPLKMTDTTFKPAETAKVRIAPTSSRAGKPIIGDVHDPRAFALGGVAGHAGLFSSADDLTRYCRMVLRGGELDGTRVLAALSVKSFTEPHAVPGGKRSLGWDVDTSFSSLRGDGFTKGEGFGHTGFTGTSLWIDPPSKTAIIILTSRLHPNEKGNVTELRKQIGTIVASAILKR